MNCKGCGEPLSFTGKHVVMTSCTSTSVTTSVECLDCGTFNDFYYGSGVLVRAYDKLGQEIE
jgi:RNase P subunit RPR2